MELTEFHSHARSCDFDQKPLLTTLSPPKLKNSKNLDFLPHFEEELLKPNSNDLKQLPKGIKW